jgi:hemerythrin-like metal-binding protein
MEAHVTLLTWNHACSVGVRAMDNQHGVLMDAMNDLRLAVVHGSGRESVCELLDHFIEFMRMHFTCEERLMEKTGFPGLSEHRAIHQSIMAQILQSAHRLQYGDGVDISALLCLLKDGYIEHIAGIDQQYGQWLNDHGVH